MTSRQWAKVFERSTFRNRQHRLECLIDVFAAHRHEVIEECAEVLENEVALHRQTYGGPDTVDDYGRMELLELSQAIRQLAEKK